MFVQYMSGQKVTMTSIVLHKCQKIPSSDYIIMHMGNTDIKVHFELQLQLPVCNTKQEQGFCVEKMHLIN